MSEPGTGLGAKSAVAKRLRRLAAKRSARDDERVLLLEGIRAVDEALDADAELEGLYVESDGADRVERLRQRAVERGIPVIELAAGVITKVSDTVTAQPVMAVAAQPARSLEDLPEEGMVFVLSDVREPGNAGTIVRSAEAAGAAGVVFCEGTADPWSPKVVRATVGALFHVPIVKAGRAGEVLDVLAQRGMRRLGTAAAAGTRYDQVDWTTPTALVLGNEAWGVTPGLEASIDEWVHIPMRGRADSLNVAMAASVLAFEAQRTRRNAESA